MIFNNIESEIQFITQINQSELYILREDQIHPTISGNKFRKLAYNIQAFQEGNYDTILTFGGAFSNHIYATAAAGKELGIQTIGVIRGDEWEKKIGKNPTLGFAKECGTHLKFITRKQYRSKSNPEFINELRREFGNIYLLPEGGTNDLAIKGCEEILGNHTEIFSHICCAVGTGGTITGLINSSNSTQKIIGFPVLKNGFFLENEIKNYSKKRNWELQHAYHFGGYAKVNDELLDFINNFRRRFEVNLDPIYTGKMVYGVMDLLNKSYFPIHSKILAIHTGGLQGIEGMNQFLSEKNKKLIQ